MCANLVRAGYAVNAGDAGAARESAKSFRAMPQPFRPVR